MSGDTFCDFLVIGAGIAGASVAYELAAEASVIVLEREDQPGYHTTGRSAAVFSETYGNQVIRALTSASREFFENPPGGFTEVPLLTPQGLLLVGRADQRDQVEERAREFHASVESVGVIEGAEVEKLVPVLRPGYVDAAVFEPAASRIDVNALHQGYLDGFRQRGGRIVTGAGVTAIARAGGNWRIETAAGEFSSPVLINAAGAWGDEIAAAAGAPGVGLEPRRRTIAVIDPPGGTDVGKWPGVVSIDESFYFMAESGRILLSPADETPSPPCDAQPEELDVALAVDRFEHVTNHKVPAVLQKWAGLRTFTPDMTPVVGFDASARGFFWLAGQGGYGIQTAPAMARLAAALARGLGVPAEFADRGVDEARLSPARFR